MSFKPRKPLKGGSVFHELYRSICEIIDYLPSLEVRGDNRTVKVNESSFGKTIETIPQQFSSPGGSEESSENVYLGKIVNGSDYTTSTNHKVLLYPNGYENPPTETIQVNILNVAWRSTTPLWK